MKKLLVSIIFAAMFSSVILAEDGVKKEVKPKEETKEKESKPKPEHKDLVIEGVVIKKIVKEDSKYYLKTSDMLLVKLPEKVGKNELNLDQYVDKQVIVKGKGTVSSVQGNAKDVKIYKLDSLASIDLKAAPEKKEEEKKPEDKKVEEKTPAK